MKKNNNFLITGATSFTGNNFIQTNNIYNYLAYIKGNKNNSDNSGNGNPVINECLNGGNDRAF